MSKVTILGAGGMLGHQMVKVLRERGHVVRGVGRDMFDVSPTTEQVVGVKLWRVVEDDTKYVINCIGAIKPAFKGNLTTPIYTNAIFPRQLADVCEKMGRSLIHITTDCVFDGKEGPYDENSKHNADDEYGKSKSLGEPSNCLVIRTSIIGPEAGGNRKSLVEWVRSQNGNKINGFTNHLWNGLTTKELSKCISDIIDCNLYRRGTYHLHSTDISKNDLVTAIAINYKLDMTITPVQAPQSCDRRLRSVKELQTILNPLDMDEQLREMVND
jgi:dTDP-4-dehydrorhamnose reductase